MRKSTCLMMSTLCLLPGVLASAPLTIERDTRLMIQARVNGTAVTALLDSAAEATMIDPGFAKRIALKPAQTVTGKGSGESSFDAGLASGVRLQAAGVSMKDQTIAIVDLADVGQRLLGHPIDMVLGREIFDAARLAIDIDARTLVAVSRKSRPAGQRLALVTEHEVETIPARVEDHDVRALFDLGNGSNVLVSRAFAQRAGLLTDGRAVGSEQGGGLGGATARATLTLRSLDIAGVHLTDVPAAIDDHDNASDINVGVSVLRRFRITTDFAQHAVWLDPR